MLVEAIEFKNFKALRDTTLPLGPFTVLVGPNGSGKSTAIRALFMALGVAPLPVYADILSVSAEDSKPVARVNCRWAASIGFSTQIAWTAGQPNGRASNAAPGASPTAETAAKQIESLRERVKAFSFDPRAISQPAQLVPNAQLAPNGAGLAAVLDQLRDRDPDRFDALNGDLRSCLPEYDRLAFETPAVGVRAFGLRTAKGRRPIPARELSDGTLLAVAILALSHAADPPVFIALEEPDHGVHPRLLRQLQDALYRLAHPQDQRAPVQVLITTHSPYFLDLFRDHPEEVVIAHKDGLDARFERLSDRKDIDEILSGGQLGEIWYSGVLGGVPGR